MLEQVSQVRNPNPTALGPGVKFAKMDTPAGGDVDAVDESKTLVWNACGCCNTSLYFDCPACIGCSGNNGCLCCEFECCCKADTKALCCGCCACKCVKLDSCCHGQQQCFCCVDSCSFPTNAETPFIIALCFLVCYPKFKCCVTQGILTGNDLTVAADGGPSVPEALEMVR